MNGSSTISSLEFGSFCIAGLVFPLRDVLTDLRSCSITVQLETKHVWMPAVRFALVQIHVLLVTAQDDCVTSETIQLNYCEVKREPSKGECLTYSARWNSSFQFGHNL